MPDETSTTTRWSETTNSAPCKPRSLSASRNSPQLYWLSRLGEFDAQHLAGASVPADPDANKQLGRDRDEVRLSWGASRTIPK